MQFCTRPCTPMAIRTRAIANSKSEVESIATDCADGFPIKSYRSQDSRILPTARRGGDARLGVRVVFGFHRAT